MQLVEDIKRLCGFTEDRELADLLRKDKSTISKWRSSGEIPARMERDLRNLATALFEDPGELHKIQQAGNVEDYFKGLRARYQGERHLSLAKKKPTLEATAEDAGGKKDVVAAIFARLSEEDQLKHLRAMLKDLPPVEED